MIQEHHSAETTVSVPAVASWQRYPSCPKCGSSLGAGVPGLRRILLAFGLSSQNYGWCKGDYDSTMQINVLGLAKMDVPTVCFGLFHDHQHLTCGRCRYAWLIAIKPEPRAHKFNWPAFWSMFWKCLVFTLLGILIDATVAHCETAADKPRSCRVEWVAPTGLHGHGDWMDYDDAMAAAKTSAFMYGVPAKVICRQRSHFDHMDWILLASDSGLRWQDAWSTRNALEQGDHENVLPDFISHHTPAMYAYSATVVGFNFFLARQLARHGHTRWAKLVYFADIGVEAPTLRNITLPASVPQRFKRIRLEEK